MNSLVPGFTVHEKTGPPGNGASVPPRSMQPEPPPKGLSAIGSSKTLVHIAVRLFSSLFDFAPPAGAAETNAMAAIDRIRAIRDAAPPLVAVAAASSPPAPEL